VTSIRGFSIRRFSPVYGKFLFRLPEKAEVLDVGCGNGDSLKIIAALRPDLSLYGVDIEEFQGGIGFLKGFRRADLNMEPIDFPDGKFDGIRICHVLEHLTDLRVLRGEIRRLLKPGGLVYMETPNETACASPHPSTGSKAVPSLPRRPIPRAALGDGRVAVICRRKRPEVLVAQVIRNPWKIPATRRSSSSV
jgi:2-polyprenyl-3-methyl-5-hydroxy-6-metoxy-1,4-benzoquinol methylase